MGYMLIHVLRKPIDTRRTLFLWKVYFLALETLKIFALFRQDANEESKAVTKASAMKGQILVFFFSAIMWQPFG